MRENCVLVLPVNTVYSWRDALASLVTRHTTMCLDIVSYNYVCKNDSFYFCLFSVGRGIHHSNRDNFFAIFFGSFFGVAIILIIVAISVAFLLASHHHKRHGTCGSDNITISQPTGIL